MPCICLSINHALLFYVNYHCPLRAPDLEIKDIVLYYALTLDKAHRGRGYSPGGDQVVKLPTIKIKIKHSFTHYNALYYIEIVTTIYVKREVIVISSPTKNNIYQSIIYVKACMCCVKTFYFFISKRLLTNNSYTVNLSIHK